MYKRKIRLHKDEDRNEELMLIFVELISKFLSSAAFMRELNKISEKKKNTMKLLHDLK